MAADTELGKHWPDPLNGEQDFDHELQTLHSPQPLDDGMLSIQVLEFKTTLQEAVEELHIRRDAEMRFEEQLNKIVLEKQELEWEKESLQHQIDTLVNQHNESLAVQKKQFQARVADIEGEKGKLQLSAELKDREIARLKEELKQLQLFKYTLQKKLSELEQKLQLQVQARDSHLTQLSEVERRFVALSRQYTTVKQAHEKLAQNVEEALRLNKKLRFVNSEQEKVIRSLKQDVEKANSEVIKGKVFSACKSGDEVSTDAIKQQEMQQLQHRLNVETEMNKQLMRENAAAMAEKKEVVHSLRQTMLLLQAQTVALSQTEQALSAQREEHQALKREHKLFQEKIQEKRGQIDSLMEDHNRTKAEWKNEEEVAEIPGGLCLDVPSSHGDLKEHEENRGSPEISGESQCETADRPKENLSLEGYTDEVQRQVSRTQRLSDCNEIGVDGQAPDTDSNPGPVELGETARIEDPQSVRHQTSVVSPLTGNPDVSVLASDAAAADTVDMLAVSGTMTEQERDSDLPQSHGGIRSRADSEPDKCSSQSTKVEHDGDFESKPEGTSALSSDCAGGGQEGGDQEAIGCIPKTASQTSNKLGRGSPGSAGCGPLFSGEAGDFQMELNEDRPELSEMPHSDAPQRNVECPLDTLVSNIDSNINPCPTEGQLDGASGSDERMAMETKIFSSTSVLLLSSHPDDLASTSTRSDWDQKVVKESDELEHSKMVPDETSAPDEAPDLTCSSVVSRACDVDANAQPNSRSFAASAVSHCLDVTADEVCVSEFQPSHGTTTTMNGASRLKSADRAEESVQRFESSEENTLTEESSPTVQPRIADTPETLSVERSPLNSSNPSPSEQQEVKEKPLCAESGGAGATANKRFRSSFDLELLMRARGSLSPRDPLGFISPLRGEQSNWLIGRPLSLPMPSFLKTKIQPRPGLQGLLSPLTVSMLQKHKPVTADSPAIKRATDMLNPSSIHPRHKRDPREEWNAIAQTFRETSAGLNTLTEYANSPGRYTASAFPSPAHGSVGMLPPSVPHPHSPSLAHAADDTASGSESDRREQSHISNHMGEAEKPSRKRKLETEEVEVDVSTDELQSHG
ncbi:hypothetical protein GJAV_G00229470 [Gymnothorax javanicus]|nr:hypothetical protein GJAV_G00229470 [Gymnothorax javanicus]